MSDFRVMTLEEVVMSILRTNPVVYKLQMDKFGFISVNELLNAVAETYDKSLTKKKLLDLFKNTFKEKVELSEDKRFVRATALHERQLEVGIKKEVPSVMLLYCAINKDSVEKVTSTGLVADKNFVRVVTTVDGALDLYGADDTLPAICVINRKELTSAGFEFYFIDGYEWFIEAIPPEYITIALPESKDDVKELIQQCSAVSHYLKEA